MSTPNPDPAATPDNVTSLASWLEVSTDTWPVPLGKYECRALAERLDKAGVRAPSASRPPAVSEDTRQAAIRKVAENQLRRYEDEFDASHLSWQDFEASAREDVDAAAGLLRPAVQDTQAINKAVARKLLELEREVHDAGALATWTALDVEMFLEGHAGEIYPAVYCDSTEKCPSTVHEDNCPGARAALGGSKEGQHG